MSEALPVITISTDAVPKHAATEIVTDNAPGRLHCRGPLDGSLYAKVNKSRKCENGENHCVEKDPCAPVNQEENAAVNQSSECANPQNPNVVVLNGNKIVFKPQSHPGSPTVKAPLANLNEFNSLFSLDSCEESYPSFSTVTKLSVTSYDSVTQSSAELLPAPPGYQEIMADGPTSQAVSGEVLGRSSKSKRKAGDKARFSEVSSCSATTLGSTTSGEDGPQMELSDNDTSDSCSIHEVRIQCIEGALSPLTVQGSVSPELFAYSPVKDTRDIPTDITNSSTAPTTPAPAVPRPSDNAAQNSHGILSSADYNKSSEYAVPMRDMKITTVTSKRAVLVSTGSEHDMASPSADRRDSVYDEGNTYNGAGYSTIEEYEEDQHSVAIKNPESNDHSYIPEDVQELLNGLTDCTPISDIDSGFHGSSMALQSTSQRGLFESNNMTSQSSSEASDSMASPAPAGDSPDASPNRGIPGSPDRSSPKAPTPGVAARVGFFDARASHDKRGVAFEVRKPPVEANGFSNVTNVASVTPKKNTNPGVPIPTQTYPEPKPAQVQVITMRNVYTDGQSMAHQSQSAPAKSPGGTPKTPTTLKTQPSTTAYQQQPAKTVEKPPLPPTNTEPVTMRRPPVAAMSDDDEEDLEDELDVENIRSMEEQIKHTQRHLEFLREQQEKLKKRKQDRTKYRETLKRNSTNFERYSQGYNNPPVVTTGLHAYHSAQDLKREVSQNGHVAHKTNGSPAVDNSGAMPAIANVNPGFGRPLSAQHVTSQSSWNGGHEANHLRRNPSYTEVETARPEIPKKSDKQPVFRRHQDKDDIIMSSDLQEQLAELDKCIAELTTTMDIPSPRESVDTEPTPPKQQLHNSQAQAPPSNTNLSPPIPSPPRRSKSSFDSYKRLSHDFDPTSPRKSSTDPSSPDDVFSPAPQTPRSSKKQNPFPPQTNVTRRQQTAPPPPPKRRMSLEERLSPILVQALASNPGAKPKEDIHSYREDLAPEAVPATPTFPTTPSTPYVNSDSPMRSKSPPGMVKTPLSMLRLKPTDTPQDNLSPHEPAATPTSQTSPQDSPVREDTVDGIMKEVQEVIPEPQISPAVALQNGLAKETDLITDDTEPKIDPKPESFVGNGQVPNGVARQVIIPEVQVPVLNTPEAQPTPPTSLDLAHANHPNGTIVKAQINRTPDQGSPSPLQQYVLHNSSGSHSSHSPAATSSNSRRESSDSLDGPSTRHSNSSILSSSSSSSATHNATHGLHGARALRPGSQLSNYDRHHLMASGTRSGDESLESPRSGRTSSSSISDAEKMNQYDTSNATVSTAPKFIRDTTAYWYKPNIVRDEALAILRPKPAGSFIVRDSRCFPGAFGLALKVDKLPTNVQLKPGADIANEYVRHFLIEPSSRGVKLKGCPNEPVFGSLSALVYQHSITPLALPCKLIIPTADQEIPKPPSPQARQPEPTPSPQATAAELLKQGAACNVIYLGSVDTESLTGPLAIERAIRETYQVARSNPNSTSIVHFKVTPQGITLTDNARKLFFRKHYPTETVTYCGLDPLGGANKSQKFRRWDATGVKGSADAWLFGFVARKQAGATGNTCLVFAELDPAQPARAVVNFVMKVLIGFSRQNSST